MPETGSPVDLDSLVFAEELGQRRSRLLDVLERLGTVKHPRALKALAISRGQSDDIAADARLRAAPAAPATDVYAGVLFERLGFGALPAAARRRASSQLLISSALWGLLRPDDRIPYYRLPAKAKLPQVGALSAFWRPALARAMTDEEGSLIVDMRSSAYSSAWRPRKARLLTVRAFTEQGGERKVITHMAKETRGEATRLLLLADSGPSTAEDVASIVEAAGYRVELTDDSLDVIGG